MTVRTWVFRINKVFSCFFVLQVQQIDRVVEVVDEAVKGILPQKGTHTHAFLFYGLCVVFNVMLTTAIKLKTKVL